MTGHRKIFYALKVERHNKIYCLGASSFKKKSHMTREEGKSSDVKDDLELGIERASRHNKAKKVSMIKYTT